MTLGIESAVRSEYVAAVDARLASRDAYIEYQIREAERALPFLSRFFPIQSAQVLEIGSGLGGKGIAYARAGMKVTSLDIDVTSLAYAAQAADRRSAALDVLVSDGMRLPFPEESFDAILLDSVMEHVDDPRGVLGECARVLKRGGIVFVVFPPYYGPLSGHIDDYISIPWFHLLPRHLVRRALLACKQDKGILSPQITFQVYMSLNGMTIRNFRRHVSNAGLKIEYWLVRPFLTHPGTRLVVRMAGAIKRPPRLAQLRAALKQAWSEFSVGTALLFLLLGAISPLVFVPILQEIAAGGCKCILRKPEGARVG